MKVEKKTQKEFLSTLISRATWVVIVLGFSFVVYGIYTGLSKIFSL